MKRSTMEFRWGTSRGAETYGYTTCACRVDGNRLGFCLDLDTPRRGIREDGE